MFKTFYAILMIITVMSDILSNKKINKWELVIWKIVAGVGVLIN